MKLKESYHPYAMLTILFWSLAYVFTRLALQHFSSFSLGFLRYFTASSSLILIVLIIKLKPPKRSDIKLFVLAGAAGFFLYILAFNKGCETVTATTSSVIIAMVPIFTAIFARIIYKERLKRIQWIAILIGFTGVIVLTVMKGGLSVNLGLLWLLGASVLLSLYNILQRHLTKTYSALQTSAFSIFCGTILLAVFIPSSIKELANVPLVPIIYILILGIFSSAIAYCSWAKAFSKAKQTSSVSNYMFVTPLLTSILGFVIAGETIDISTLVGGTIIILSLLIFNIGGKYHNSQKVPS
jgi:drug/metabolite transporter (DMT)-like permease